MATYTIKKIPDALYTRLKERAERHHRSINSEIIACLEQMLPPAPRDPEEAIAEAEALDRELGITFSAETIAKAKREGRS